MNTDLGNSVAAFQYLGGRGILPTAVVETFEATKDRLLPIHVLVTDLQSASAALHCAVRLAADLGAETRVLVPQVVPYPLDLEYPAISLEFTCKQLQMLAASAGADPYIYVYLCRDAIDLLRVLLPERAIVVLSAPQRWSFLTKAGRIARALKRQGCAVIVV
jgi:hypothetical protein